MIIESLQSDSVSEVNSGEILIFPLSQIETRREEIDSVGTEMS